jgi:Putative transposase/Transposase zinc-binding domain
VKIIQKIKEGRKDKPFYSVKIIFENHWEDYLRTHKVRDVELNEVEKMLSCKGLQRGCFVYCCNNCGKTLVVPFGCNSRLCSCCGKRHTDKWAERLTRKIIRGITYRHLTFSMPDILWNYIMENRNLQKVIMDTASQTIKEMFSLAIGFEINVGIVEVLHPFGRDLVFKPHVHALATEGGYNSSNKFISLPRYINYDSFHKKWQYNLLTALRNYIPQQIIDLCFRKYPKGFVAYIKPDKLYYGKGLIRYIGRYIRHPAIANSRIIDYNRRGVTFYYEDHDKNKHFKTMHVFDFISAIIQHIPERNFRMVRYYGIYSRNNIKRFMKVKGQLVIEDKILNKSCGKRVVYCPCCFERMELIMYVKKPPSKDMSLIINW